jgi:hypothetical protein
LKLKLSDFESYYKATINNKDDVVLVYAYIKRIEPRAQA